MNKSEAATVRRFLHWLADSEYVVGQFDHRGMLWPNGNNVDQWVRAFESADPVEGSPS